MRITRPMREILAILKAGGEVRRDKVFVEKTGRWEWEWTAAGAVVRGTSMRALEKAGWIRPEGVGDHVLYRLTDAAGRVIEEAVESLLSQLKLRGENR